MRQFARAGSVPLFSMLGRSEPSRAINESDGTDPISLGLISAVPGAPPPSSMFSAPDAGIPASVLADAPAIHMAQPLHLPAPERTVLPPVVQNLPAATNVLLLDDGRVSLNGRQFILPAEVYEHVLEEVISAYEGDLAAEVAFYRSRMQPSSRARKKKMRKASRKSAVVRRVPKQAARAKSAKPRPKAAPDVQPLPESTETK